MPEYGKHHRALRKQYAYAVESGHATCWRCGRPILRGEEWHLGHDDRGESYAGPEHALCSSRSGAARAAELIRKGREAEAREAEADGLIEPPISARWSQHWYGGFDERCPDCRELGAACEGADK